MTATYTSLTSHRHHVLSGKATSQRNRILTCLFESGVPLSRRQIQEITRIEMGSVTGRANTLLKSDLIRVAYEAKNSRGQPIEYLEPIWPQLKQKELF